MSQKKSSISESIYSQIKQTINVLEEERYRLKVIFHTVGIVFTVIFLLTINTLIYYNDWGLRGFIIYGINLFCIFFGFVVGAITISKRGKKYSKNIEKAILNAVFSYSFPNINNKPFIKVEKKWCYDSKLFVAPSQLNFKSSDYFTGKIGKISFEVANLKLHIIAGEDRKPKFQGLFFKFRVEKSFESITRIWTKERLHAQNVKPLDSRFYESFYIHTKNQNEAHFILSTSIMNKLHKFYIETNTPIQMSFTKNSIYLGLSQEKHSLEAKLFWPNKTKEIISKTIELVQFAEEIINELNLDKATWSGQDNRSVKETKLVNS